MLDIQVFPSVKSYFLAIKSSLEEIGGGLILFKKSAS